MKWRVLPFKDGATELFWLVPLLLTDLQSLTLDKLLSGAVFIARFLLVFFAGVIME